MKRALFISVALVLIGCPDQDVVDPTLDTDTSGEASTGADTTADGDVDTTGGDTTGAETTGDDDAGTTGADDTTGTTTGGTTGPDVTPTGCMKDDDCVEELGALGACEVPICEDGKCFKDGVPNGTKCDDDAVCTIADKCLSGQCTGVPVDCGDDNPCTKDWCEMGTGECLHSPEDGAPCDDGDPCTTDTCQSGSCTSVDAECPKCQKNADCLPLDDGNKCNGTLICKEEKCVTNPATIVDCSQFGTQPCQKAVCVVETGACQELNLMDGAPCTPQSPCQQAGFCISGTCKGPQLPCNDDNSCTKDSCDTAKGCVFEPVDGGSCSDGSTCTMDDVCVEGQCKGVAIADCDDNDPCTIDGCDAATAECTYTMTDGPCDDGTKCTGADECSGGTCAGTPINCDDGSACTDDSCDPQTGCVYSSIGCTDGNPCTTDTCTPDGGCQFAPIGGDCASDEDCDDNDACTEEKCTGCGECTPTPIICDDANACTQDSCSPGTGCVFAPLPGMPCEDDDPCTIAQACTADGQCGGGVGNPECNPTGAQDDPALHCAQILNGYPESMTGEYWLKTSADADAFPVFCDMSFAGGGWTRVANVQAETPICSYADGMGSPEAVIAPDLGTGILSLDQLGDMPGKEVMIQIGTKHFIWTSSHVAWGWAAVASGIISAKTVGEYNVMGGTETNAPKTIAFKGCQKDTGSCLLGGAHGDGGPWTPILGSGAQGTGEFAQDGACAASPADKGMFGGVTGGNSWGRKGQIYIR